jgi:hypothetical protein
MQGVGEPPTMTTEGEVLRHAAVGLDLQSQGESADGMRTGKRRLHPRDGGQGIEAEKEERGENGVPCRGNEARPLERDRLVE